MNADTIALLVAGLLLLLAFYLLFDARERLEHTEARLADTRLRLFAWAELVRDGETVTPAQLERLFPEIITRIPNPRDRKQVAP